MNGGFNFEEAEVDPWAQLDVDQKYYVVVIRTKNGQAALSLISASTAENAAGRALSNLTMQFVADLKDVSVVEFVEMEQYSLREIQTMINKTLGVNDEMS